MFTCVKSEAFTGMSSIENIVCTHLLHAHLCIHHESYIEGLMAYLHYRIRIPITIRTATEFLQ